LQSGGRQREGLHQRSSATLPAAELRSACSEAPSACLAEHLGPGPHSLWAALPPSAGTPGPRSCCPALPLLLPSHCALAAEAQRAQRAQRSWRRSRAGCAGQSAGPSLHAALLLLPELPSHWPWPASALQRSLQRLAGSAGLLQRPLAPHCPAPAGQSAQRGRLLLGPLGCSGTAELR
jgi:hypothetical protein